MILLQKKAKKKARQRAILSRTSLDIVATTVLNFCVRDGNRCVHRAITTRLFLLLKDEIQNLILSKLDIILSHFFQLPKFYFFDFV